MTIIEHKHAQNSLNLTDGYTIRITEFALKMITNRVVQLTLTPLYNEYKAYHRYFKSRFIYSGNL